MIGIQGSKPDGAKLAILNSRIEGIAKKMANTLLRTGRSGVLNRARDFSVCVVTRDARLLSSAEGLPIHVLVGADMMCAAMCRFHPVLKRGDAFLHNSPYHGNSHAGDHTLIVPVIDSSGEHQLSVIAKAHQADIGNSLPITLHASAKDVYEEGALIFPCVKVQENYKTIGDFQRMCEMRIRVPEQWRGDFLAMVGAARVGEREFLALGDEIGWEAIHSFSESWFDYSEARMIDAIRAMPIGRASWTSIHDPFPGTPKDGVPIKATVEIRPDEATIDVDFRDNIDNLPCGLNLTEACSRTAAMVGIFNSIDHTVPKNAGSFRRIRVQLREGAVVGIPRHPVSTSLSTTNIADNAAHCVQCAIAEIADGYGMAENGYPCAPSMASVSGVDPRNHKPYINMIFLGHSGGAASSRADCWFAVPHVGNGGLCWQDSVELDELYHPLVVYSRHILPDTEGAGTFRGAPSLYVEYGPVGAPMDAGFASAGTINPARGVRGGLPGGPSGQFLRRLDGTIDTLAQFSVITLQPGERMMSRYCGGGGYGPPMKRNPDAVLHDVEEGWITRKRAADVYGVVIDDASMIDVPLTHFRRSAASATAL
jgi:N-methylhydantoinase B